MVSSVALAVAALAEDDQCVQNSDTNAKGKIKALAQPADRRGRERVFQAGLKMQIGPIPGITALSAAPAAPADSRPPAIFDIDPSAKPGDGEGQKNSRKAAGAEEDEEEVLTLGSEMEAGTEAPEEVPARRIDYFA